ncbi:MAG: dTDP-4-dehydrorhamnose 3,5-epimerase family protein [Magnetococcales bacterium]|nr:dTDP-4-dehydrorhamnose 3,5-epimerase family protein [Magnetococcales bacterium]
MDNIRVEETKMPGVLKITLDPFEDHRGHYVELYNEKLYQQHGIDMRFIQDDISVSDHHVLRGIHGDRETWKLISCLHGRFYLVVVNGDRESERFGEWQSFVLSDINRQQILVPPNHGNAHLILSDSAIFHYKQTTYYNPSAQFTMIWNDPELGIWWPIEKPILSRRDQAGHFVD